MKILKFQNFRFNFILYQTDFKNKINGYLTLIFFFFLEIQAFPERLDSFYLKVQNTKKYCQYYIYNFLKKYSRVNTIKHLTTITITTMTITTITITTITITKTKNY